MSLSKLNGWWEEYLEQLEKNPVVTKALTAAFTSVVSDVLAQYLTGTPLVRAMHTAHHTARSTILQQPSIA